MTSATQVIKSAGPKLVPFFKTLAIYFVVFIPHDQPSILAAILKCLPIVSLIIFVVLYGMNLEDEHRWYVKRIVAGLVFCCIGDACLIWQKYFPIGMVMFAIGHINYIMAFGFKPLALRIGLVLYLFSLLSVAYMMPGLHGVLVLGVPIYSFILITMLWRTLANMTHKDGWTWINLITVLGAASFVVSDGFIGLDHFMSRITHSQALIMATYYAGQLGLALSVLDPRSLQEKKVK